MSVDHTWFLFKQGDQQAFELIYREHIDSLYGYGRRFSRDSTLVEDCIQDMFIDLWDKRERLGDTDNVKAYLFVSLRRSILKKVKKRTQISDYDESIFDATLSIDTMMIQEEINKEQSLRLKKAFDQLNSKQQHIIYLKYHQNFTGKEIAKMLNINNQSVRNALSRAILKLKKTIGIWILSIMWIEILQYN